MHDLPSDRIGALERAIRTIEESSAAEIVVEVRAWSGSYAHADQKFAAYAAGAVLLFVLFAPLNFAPWLVPFMVGLSYGGALLLSRSTSSLRRGLTSPAHRRASVRMAAASSFVERGVARTRRATGLLVLWSRLERQIEIVADNGILEAVPSLEWNQVMESAAAGGGLDELLAVLEKLRVLLSRYLPREAGDVNELPDELRMSEP